jgi:hypothetical protein
MPDTSNRNVVVSPQHADKQRKGFYSGTAVKTVGNQAATPASSSNMIADIKNQLGMLDHWAIGRRAGAERRKVMAEIVVNAYEKQKQLILFQLTLELSDEKKRLFAESLREGTLVEKEILMQSTAHEDALIDFVLEETLAGQDKAQRRLDGLDARLASGAMTQEAYSQEKERTKRWSLVFLDNVDAKVEMMLRNHAQIIEKALTLYNERAIPGVSL